MSDPLRFFASPDAFQGNQVILTGEPLHHLRNVLRAKPGTTVILMNGLGLCCQAIVTEINAHTATADILRRWQAETEPLPITLMQALPKGDKLDLVLQKGTELGISCFQPLESDHAVPQLDAARRDKRQQRWQRIVNEAARQCRRSTLPEVEALKPLQQALTESTADLKLVLWEAGAVALAERLPPEPPDSVALLVGPEGGFSARELTEITNAGFQPVHLGPRILRTETAGLAATPVLQYLYGDWRQAPDETNQ